MSDPEQNRLTACKKFLVSKKNPCGVPFIPPHGFVFQIVGAVASGELNRAETRHIPWGTNDLYLPIRPSLNLCKIWLGLNEKLVCGRVGTSSATDLSMLSFTGVNRMAWMLPASGPLRTIAMAPICPRSLILLAMVANRLELANSVLRSVITPSCQIKAWAQLKLESKVLPTTWPRLLMPLAMAAKSPGRGFKLVSVPFCQNAPYWVVPSGLPTAPTIWSRSLLPKATPPCCSQEARRQCRLSRKRGE